MSVQNKKTLLMTVAAVAILAVAGVVTMMSQKSSDAPAQDQASSAENAPMVESAAGNPDQDAKDEPEEEAKINVEGIQVEPGNPIVAKVGGKDVTRLDVYRFIKTMPANVQQMPAAQVYPVAMEEVINTRMVQNLADEAGIIQTEDFKKEMEIAAQQIARNLYLQQQVEAKVSKSMVSDAYDEFIKKIPDVEERRASHILVETEDKAKEAIEKLNKGEDFAAVAKEMSKDPMAANGGDLGYFIKTEMVPEFANAAFAMNKDEVSATAVKTQFGYHVIKVTEIRQRPKPSQEQLEPMLRADLNRKALADLVQKWRKDAKVEQFDINGKPLQEGANALGVVPPKAAVAPAPAPAPETPAPANNG